MKQKDMSSSNQRTSFQLQTLSSGMYAIMVYVKIHQIKKKKNV